MRNALALCPIAVCAALLGCSGDVARPNVNRDNAVGSPGAGGTGGGAGNSGAPDPDIAEADQRMQEANPELFDLASMYFPGTSASGGHARMFRLTREQLDLTARNVFPELEIAPLIEVMPGDPLEKNYEFADNLSWNAANFTPYTTWAAEVAAAVGADPSQAVACDAADAPCLTREGERLVAHAFRGVTTPEQLSRFSAFFVARAAEVGLPEATANLVDVMLTSPRFVFREEVHTDAQAFLLPASRLQAVTYTLTDAPPAALGLAPERALDHLGTPAQLESTLDALLARPEARDKLLRFFLAWLEVKEPDEFTIAPNVFPEWTPELAQAMVDETRAFLAHQLQGAQPTLKSITQATQSFVSDALEEIYGVQAQGGSELTALSANERLGIFSQPAVIASHSGPTNTRLIKRGVFFTRKVMCLPLGNPPEGIDTTIPMNAGATERERIESVTAVQPCSGCHTFINPFGFMQESYDAIGRYRTTDEEGLPINPRISVDFLDEGPLSTNTTVEALAGFTGSARFKQCFARQLFRFYMGRDEEAGDDPLLRQMFFAFADKDEQGLVSMLRILAGSPSFAQRVEAP